MPTPIAFGLFSRGGVADSQSELEQKYQDKFNERIEQLEAAGTTEASWKKANAGSVLANEKCGWLYSNYSDGDIDAAAAAAIDNYLGTSSTYSDKFNAPSQTSAASGPMYSSGRRSRTENVLNQAYVATGCGSDRQIQLALDKAWQEFRAESLQDLVDADINALGVASKQKGLECVENLENAKKALQQAIDLFFEGASDPAEGMFEAGFDANTLRGSPPIQPGAPTAQEVASSVLASGAPDALATAAAQAMIDERERKEKQHLMMLGMEAPPPGVDIYSGVDRGKVGNAIEMLINLEPPVQVPTYMRPFGQTADWDHVLISDEARQNLKYPEFYGDLKDRSAATMASLPHMYASFIIGLHNLLEANLIPLMPSEAEVKAFSGGVDGSSASMYNKAQSILDYFSPAATGTPGISFRNMPSYVYSDPGLIDYIDDYCAPAASRLPGGPLKSFLVSNATSLLPMLKSLLESIKSCASDIKEAKDEFDDAVDDLLAAVPDAARDALDNDAAEDAFNQAINNMGDTDLDDIGFGTVEDKKLFKEQCFLLAFAAKLADFKNKTLEHVDDKFKTANPPGVTKRLPYSNIEDLDCEQTDFAQISEFNASLQMNGDSFGFINRLTQSPNYGDLIDIPHYQLSALQPMIRLFKVEYNEDMENDEFTDLETEVEMKFDSTFSRDELENIFLGRRTRSAGVGLKEFEFTYDGSNPFSYKKSIKAKLVLHAATFQELFLERDGDTTTIENGALKLGGTKKYRYIDLALKTFSKFTNNSSLTKKYQRIFDENANLAKLNFRLKAVVGWSVPKGGLPGLNPTETEKLRTVLANSFVTLNLTPTIHNFNFEQNGSVNFEINYLAYIDDFFDDRGFNIFADPTGVVGWQRELRKMQMQRIRSKCSSAEEIQDLNSAYAQTVTKEINQSLSSLMSAMIQQKKIYYINIDYDKIQNFISSGPFETYESYIVTNADGDAVLSDDNRDEVQQEIINDAFEAYSQQLQSTDEDAAEASLKAALFAASPQSNELSFFYLSDLVDVILQNIEMELEKLADQYKLSNNKKEYTTTSSTNEDLIHIDDWNKRRSDLEKYRKNMKRFRLILGPLELVHHSNKESGAPSVFVSFGDLPISVKYFLEWIAGKVLSKDEVFYSLSAFLNQLMNNLVTKFLNNNRCFYFDIKQKARVNQSTLTSFSAPEYGGLDEITYLLRRKAKAMKNLKYAGNPTKLNVSDAVVTDHRGLNADGTIKENDYKNLAPILNVSGRPNNKFSNYSPLSNEINYMVFFAGRVSAHGSQPDRATDHSNGVFHYLLGRDRGLIKEINLQKTTTKGLAEVRFEQDGYDGLSQMRVIYDLDITSYANVNTYPGTYIYVPPAGFDPSFARLPPQTTDKDGKKINFDLSQLGIGGYYMIIRSTHKFAMGEATTKIAAKWVANLQNDFPAAEAGTALTTNGETDPTCGATISSRTEEMRKP